MSVLRSAVITSTLDISLPKLIESAVKRSFADCIEVFFVREIDLKQAGVKYENDFTRMATIVNRFESKILSYLKEVVSDVEVSAIATYFPGISCHSSSLREEAIDALSIALKFAQSICTKHSPKSVVEVVCGTLVDRVEGNLVRKTSLNKKIVDAVSSLVKSIEKSETNDVFVAIELEPGDLYVINNEDALSRFFSLLDLDPNFMDGLREEFKNDYNTLEILAELNGKTEILSKIGLNVDISHMIMAGVRPDFLLQEKYYQRILNAHIADHPGFHTHDQLIGRWTPLTGKNSYSEYISLLTKLSQAGKFPGAVSVELEGNSREMLMLDCLSRLKHLISDNLGAMNAPKGNESDKGLLDEKHKNCVANSLK